MSKKGFTLVEIIAVVAIMAILVTFAGTNLIKKYNQSKIDALIIQEGQLVQSGDMVIQDYCKDPLNKDFQLQCDDYYKSYVDATGDLIVDETDNTYMKYICVNDLKTLEYYSEELQLSGQNCSGVVVYKISNETDLQKDSFSVIRCGDEYVSEINNQTNYTSLFSECFTDEIEGGEEPVEQEYLLTVNFTESTPSGLKIAQSYSQKHKKNDSININVPEYETDYNEFTPFKHGSSSNANAFSLSADRTKLTGTMPNKDVVVNIVYGVSKYTLTVNYKEFNNVTGNITFPSKQFILFYGEETTIPYNNKNNFKIISPERFTYTMPQNDASIDVVYQQIEFDLIYNYTPEDTTKETGCTNRKVTYNENFGTLCTPTRIGYTFKDWKYDGTIIKSNTKNEYYNNVVLEPVWEANTYTITYYLGNGNSTAGNTRLGESTCTYDSYCKINTFASFGVEFPYTADGIDRGWSFIGWTGDNDILSHPYRDGHEFNQWKKPYNVSLYAIGERELHVYGGYDSTTDKAVKAANNVKQIWNPYSTDASNLSEVTFPAAVNLSGWTFVGYKDARSYVGSEPGIPDGNSKINANLPTTAAAKTFKVPALTWPYIRTVYKRTLTLNYDLNEGSFVDSTKTLDSLKQTDTQYYNSGIAGTDKWTKPLITSVNFTLHPRTGIQRTGHTFDGWLDGSTTGDLKAVSSTYNFNPSVTATPTRTMYVKWTRCADGKYLAVNDNQCKSCSAGTYSEGGVNSCSNCGAGKWSSSGAGSCNTCPSGYRNGSNGQKESDCEKNVSDGSYVATANGGETKCAAGTAKSAHTVTYGSTSSCDGCSKGYYSLEGATTCTQCPEGYRDGGAVGTEASCYKSVTAGNYVKSKNDKTVTSCGTGYYKAAHTVTFGSTSTCIQCPAGYRDGSPGKKESDCIKKVDDGFKVDSANGDATKCVAGTAKSAHSITYGSTSSCDDCSKGYYSLEGATTCTQCPAGYRDGSNGKKESDCIKNVDGGYKVATAKGSATTCSTGYTSAAHNVNYGGTSSCTPINYTVTISVNNSNYGTVNKTSLSIPYGTTYESSGSTITFSNGSSVTGTITSSTGYTTSFSSWSSTSGTITGDTTITANFSRVGNNYSVIYNCNGGTPINNYSSNHVYGTASNLKASQCVKTGNIFSGWKDSNNNSYTNGQSISTLVSEDGDSITLTAQWTAISYTIAFANGGGSGSMSSINATYNQVVTLPNNTFTRTNYKFTGWSGSNNVNYANGAEVSGLTTTNGATITMTANWVQSVPGTYVKFDGTYYAWWSGSDCTATNEEDSCSINYCSTVGIAQKEMYVTEIKGSVVHGWFYEGNLESEGAGGDCVRGHCADICKQRYKDSYQTIVVDGKTYVKIQIVDQADYQFRCKINGVGCR